MKARPILFSAPMIRALLDSTKTQTRRAVKLAVPDDAHEVFFWSGEAARAEGHRSVAETGLWARRNGRDGYLRFLGACPYGRPGDLLWVREAFSYETLDVDRDRFKEPWYWADGNPADGDYTRPKPSIHMPRLYSRLTLRLVDVRVERLHDISEGDALAEGVREPSLGDGLTIFTHNGGGFIHRASAPPLLLWEALWRHINGPDIWAANPWCWVLDFKGCVYAENVDRVIAGIESARARP